MHGVTELLLAVASFAIAAKLVHATRHSDDATSARIPGRARLAGVVFLVGSGVAWILGAVHADPTLLELQTILAALAAVGGLVAALAISRTRSSASTSASADASTAVDKPRVSPHRGHEPSASTSDIEESLASAPAEAGFLGLVSHELRTPLTAMQLLLDRLADSGDALNPRQRKIIERLGFTADRLTDIIDSLLYYARIQSGRLTTSVEPFDLGTLASDAAEELRLQAQRKALELETVPASERVSIESDPKLLRLVIVNLVSNAVKFTDKGTVAISTCSKGDRRVVRVEDTGRGIAKDEQARIFEPFHNIEPTKHKHQPGIGLGLSLAREIVQNLGGEITVRSEVGKGSIFELSLPAVALGRT
jgi:signal transduction histidine kinase